MATREQIVSCVKEVYDPEIPVNVYDLGLIYDIDIREEGVNITMSLTSPACPSAREIPDNIRRRIMSDLNIENVQVSVVWEPVWNPAMITEEGKAILGIEE